jgi:hypothetical protein
VKSDIIIQLHKNFEDYAHQIDGEEFWFARDLKGLPGYTQWRNFLSLPSSSLVTLWLLLAEIGYAKLELAEPVCYAAGAA